MLAITDHTTPCRSGSADELRRLSRRARGRGRAGAAPLRPARDPRARADLRRSRPGAAGARASQSASRRSSAFGTGSSRPCAPRASTGRRLSPPTRIARRSRSRRRGRRPRSPSTRPGWSPLVDRFELFNRHTLFSWVAEAGLPSVATGDFHVPRASRHLEDDAALREDRGAVVDYLRSAAPGLPRAPRRAPEAARRLTTLFHRRVTRPLPTPVPPHEKVPPSGDITREGEDFVKRMALLPLAAILGGRGVRCGRRRRVVERSAR